MFMEKTAHLLKIAAGEPTGRLRGPLARSNTLNVQKNTMATHRLTKKRIAAKRELAAAHAAAETAAAHAALTPPAETANSGKLLNKLKAWGGANKKALMIGGGVAAGLGALGGSYALRRRKRNR